MSDQGDIAVQNADVILEFIWEKYYQQKYESVHSSVQHTNQGFQILRIGPVTHIRDRDSHMRKG